MSCQAKRHPTKTRQPKNMIICRNVGSLEEGIEYNPQHLQLGGVYPELHLVFPTLNIHLLSSTVPFRLLVITMIDHNAMGVPRLCNSDTDSSRLLSGECPEVHVVLPTLNIHLLSTIPFRLLVQVRNG
jgi:hypothetical protein